MTYSSLKITLHRAENEKAELLIFPDFCIVRIGDSIDLFFEKYNQDKANELVDLYNTFEHTRPPITSDDQSGTEDL